MLDDRSFLDPHGTRAEIAALFTPQAVLARIVQLETALAEVQAEAGLIPPAAAAAIVHGGASWRPDLDAVQRHRLQVGHPMVAILNAFSEAVAPEGQEWLHFGTTTADVFRTVQMLMLHDAAQVLHRAMTRIGAQLAELARAHRGTPMIGRTLGRHALPITFGYKAAVWLAQMHRDRDRLAGWGQQFTSGVLSGAVGTHAAMGRAGPDVERAVMQRLGLGAPDPVDSKGAQDVFAAFGSVLAIAARGCHRLAQEVFLLQGDDIAELSVTTTAVGSSTMPHKVNPTLCIEVMSRAPEVSATLPVLLDWIVTIHERDSAMHMGVLEQMCIDMGQVLSCTEALLDHLVVHPAVMRANIDRTKGAVMTEHVTMLLADRMGRRSAHHLMREVSERMRSEGLSLAAALAALPECADFTVPDPAALVGEAPALVDACLSRLGYDG
ncbi:MAG: lyase family protein [Alphaproteobacteria bacterium]